MVAYVTRNQRITIHVSIPTYVTRSGYTFVHSVLTLNPVDSVYLSTLNITYRLLDSLVVYCWLRVREVPGSIPSQGPRHTKYVIKLVPAVPLFDTQY